MRQDVDGANPLSLGHLVAGLPSFAPATAEAVVRLLHYHGLQLSGMRVAVIGRSTVVGKPLAHLLLNEHATVTICHSRTKYLPAVTREADIVVAAVGRAGLVTAEYVGPDTVAIFPRKSACRGFLRGSGGWRPAVRLAQQHRSRKRPPLRLAC